MNIKKLKPIMVVLGLLLLLLQVKAQDSRVLYFMNYNPYSSYTNPGNPSHSRLYIGIPVLSNLNISLYNSAFHYNNLFKANETGTTVTADKFVNSLKKNNWLNTSLNIELLGFGFKADNLFVSVGYRIRLEEYFSFPDVLFKLPVKGNMAYVDDPAEMKKLRLNAMAYHELSVGLQYKLNEHLCIGIRPKLLMGLANINTKNSYFKMTTDPQTYEINIQEQMHVNTAMVVNPDSVDIMKILPNVFKNMGFGIDLGATYQFNDHFGVSAAVTDLGFVKWKTNPRTFKSEVGDGGAFYQDGGFCFSGLNTNSLNMDSLSDGGIDQVVGQYKDSLLNYFPLEQTYQSYVTATYAKIYFSGYYRINKHNAFTLMFRGDIIGRSFLPSFTLAYSGNFFNMLDVYATYSIIGNDYLNVGAGLGLRLGPIQLYAATDNILAAFSPLNSSLLNVQMGLMINISDKKNKKIKSENDN